jgi:hypothetical protein
VTSKISAILSTFTEGNAHSLTEISQWTGLPLSTAHRLTTELASWGMLEKTPDGLYQSAPTPPGLRTASTAADTTPRLRPQVAGSSSTAAEPADGTRRPHSPQRPDTVTIVGHHEAGSRTLTAARASC